MKELKNPRLLLLLIVLTELSDKSDIIVNFEGTISVTLIGVAIVLLAFKQ